MSEAQPKEGDREGQSRKSGQLMVLRGLIPALLVQKTAMPNLRNLKIFGCFGALRGVVGVGDG